MDEKTYSAVLRKIEIIGEAVKNIPQEIKTQFSETPWSDMAKLRDKIIHSYFEINFETIWKVIKDRLPEIKEKVKSILINL